MYRIRTRAMHLKRREGPGNEVVRQQNVGALSRVACVADRLRACLHGVGDPGLVGWVSFVFTL